MKQVYPNKENRRYAFVDMASQLIGGNPEKILRVLIGDTNGSKSVIQKIGFEALADYGAIVPESFWDGNNKGSGPSPEKAQLRHARMAYAFELPNSKGIDNAELKRTTGGDFTYARNCGDDGGAMEILTKFQISVNGFPDIRGMDYASKSRIFMSPHETSFILKSKDPERYEELKKMTFKEQCKIKEFPAEEIDKKQITRHAMAFLWMAVKYFKVYRKEGLVPPQRMKNYIDDYWKGHDPLILFMKENIEKKEGGKVKKKELFRAYSRWFKESSFPQKQLCMSKFIETMEGKDKLKKLNPKGYWKGWAMVEQEDDDEWGN
jgi:phage/plasmid-associated DNA primase